jgi:hypothetical protein
MTCSGQRRKNIIRARLLIGLRVWRVLDAPARRVKMVERLGTRY